MINKYQQYNLKYISKFSFNFVLNLIKIESSLNNFKVRTLITLFISDYQNMDKP